VVSALCFRSPTGNSPEDAQDLTQDFFSRLLDKNYLAKADPDREKFRTFLLRSLRNFLVNEWKRAGRLKRGGSGFKTGQRSGRQFIKSSHSCKWVPAKSGDS
jgi:DNA-directed RNA polymerase specialized sigma24 family protein